MKTTQKKLKLTFFIIGTFFYSCFSFCQESKDIVYGNLIQFNDNGFWCWYQDERAVIDADSLIILAGSNASNEGFNGPLRDGNVEGIMYDLSTGSSNLYTFYETYCDDHNAPSFLILPTGNYMSFYTNHYDDYSRFRTFEGSSWSEEGIFDWNTPLNDFSFDITYSNPWYLSEENKIYNFARTYIRSPNMMVSSDMGSTWEYAGMLTKPDESIGYVNGYFKYWGNGTDRIDFLCTEHHPRDYNTNIFHGYIKGGQSFRSDGTLMDPDITDTEAPKPADFSLVFSDGTKIGDDTLNRCWNADLVRYNDGTVAAFVTARAGNDVRVGYGQYLPGQDLRFIYCRFDGINWNYTYLGKAGQELYPAEQDYTGLGTLHPNDPNTIYISTSFDPRDESDLGVREIFKGTTKNNGASWNWFPITQNSTRNNYRPIIPLWSEGNTLLMWCRGTYFSAQSFDATIVGIIDYKTDTIGLKTYFDADETNTNLANGETLTTTGPDINPGISDGLWHNWTALGNEGSVFSANEDDESEETQILKTQLSVNSSGIYDVWVNFWANPDADWRIKAGLSEDQLKLYRHMACQQVLDGEHNNSLELSAGDSIKLYQAYIGRVENPTNNLINVFIDNEPLLAGSTDMAGDITRTCYDGVSYASVISMDVSDNNLYLADTANSLSRFNIYSNIDWNILCEDLWLNIDPQSGTNNSTISLVAEANTEFFSRKTTLTISADEIVPKTINIFQRAANPELIVDEEILYAEGSVIDTLSLKIFSNTTWHIESTYDWIKFEEETGMNNDIVNIITHINPGSESREGNIIIFPEGLPSIQVQIIQDANPFIRIEYPDINISYRRTTIDLALLSNVEWEITGVENWMTLNMSSGVNSERIIVYAEANESENERTAYLTITSEETGSQTVTITQNGINIDSVKGNIADNVHIYPNPVRDELNIYIENFAIDLINYEIIDITGKRIKVNTIEYENSIDTSTLRNGLYVLKLDIYGNTVYKKFVIQF